MAGDPLEVFEELDPELLKMVRRTSELAMGEGALPRKVKFLIAMALDAAHGAADGVASLARAKVSRGRVALRTGLGDYSGARHP